MAQAAFVSQQLRRQQRVFPDCPPTNRNRRQNPGRQTPPSEPIDTNL